MEDEKKEKEKEMEKKKKGEECETKREYIGMKRFVPPPDSSCVIALDDLKTGAQRVVDEVNRTFSRDGTAYLVPPICVIAPVLGSSTINPAPLP